MGAARKGMGGSLGGLPEFDSFVVLGRAFIGLLFVVAGVTKLATRADFARTVGAYDILPASWSAPVSRVLPPLEVVTGLAFATGWAPALAGGVLVALLVAFSFGVAVNLLRGRRSIDCGCFGVRTRRGISWALVLRNAALAAVAAAAAWGAGADGPPALPSILAVGVAFGVYGAGRATVALLRFGDAAEPAREPPRAAAAPTFTAEVQTSPSREGA